MKLHNFNPEDGSFEYIANDDGTPAMTFYQIGNSGTFFQMVVGAEGSVNIDAKTPEAKEDVDLGLWPQHKGGVYIQSEKRPNWIKISPSDAGQDCFIQTGGAPYTHEVGVSVHFQGSPSIRLNRK